MPLRHRTRAAQFIALVGAVAISAAGCVDADNQTAVTKAIGAQTKEPYEHPNALDTRPGIHIAR